MGHDDTGGEGAMACIGAGCVGNSLYLPLSFAVDLTTALTNKVLIMKT